MSQWADMLCGSKNSIGQNTNSNNYNVLLSKHAAQVQQHKAG